MTDSILVVRKLSMVREHAGRVRRRMGIDATVFRADTDLQDAAAMSLLVATQEVVDIALHIAADEGWGVAGSSGEAIDVLATHAVIDEELARSLRQIVSLRHRLAHGYASIDIDRLRTELPDGLDALDHFAAAIAAWLATNDTI